MRALALFISCLLSFSVRALDTEISVLGLVLPGADANKSAMWLASLEEFWPSSSTGITIKLVNGGVPIPGQTQLQLGIAGSDLLVAMNSDDPIRNQHAADVVMFFGRSFIQGVCGEAIQRNWTSLNDGIPGIFIPAPLIDTLGSEDSYAVIVATEGVNCLSFEEVAIHELGHLFGAGHVETPETTGKYLKADSHALHIDNIFVRAKTIMAESFYTGIQTLNFSTQPSTNTDNLGTLSTTALSVANYRTAPPPPPPCTLSPPQNIHGVITGICTPSPWTRHFVTWDDSCPSATSFYEIWAAQPILNPFNFEFYTAFSSTEVFVFGEDALIKARACEFFNCTSLGLGVYLASSQCNGGF